MGCVSDIMCCDSDSVFAGVNHFFSARMNDPVRNVSLLEAKWAEELGDGLMGMRAQHIGHISRQVERELPVRFVPMVAHGPPGVWNDVRRE